MSNARRQRFGEAKYRQRHYSGFQWLPVASKLIFIVAESRRTAQKIMHLAEGAGEKE